MPAWTPPSEWAEGPLKPNQHRKSSSTPILPTPALVLSSSPTQSSLLDRAPIHQQPNDDLEISPIPPQQRPHSYHGINSGTISSGTYRPPDAILVQFLNLLLLALPSINANFLTYTANR